MADRSEKLLPSILAGGIGGVFMDAVYYPIETLKSRIQASCTKSCFSTSAKSSSLLSGFSTVLYVAFPGTALYFLGYDLTKRFMRDNTKYGNTMFASMLGGVSAEVLCNTFRNPFEVIKQQMQVGLDSSVTATCRSIVRAKGYSGYYAGYCSLLMREIPYSMIQMPVYEMMKNLTSKHTGKNVQEFSTLNNCINGAVAGGIDVIKTRLMVDRVHSHTMKETAMTIYHDEGLRGFTRGIGIRTTGLAVITSVLFVTYERMKDFIDHALYKETIQSIY